MESIVKSLLAGDWEMPLSDCVLRQGGMGSEIIYKGPGLLMQEVDKSIRLRVFAAPVEPSDAFHREFGQHLTPGVLVPDSHYFDFEGKDPYGTVWCANSISINADFGSGTYVRAQPRFFEKREERPKPAERPVVVAFLPQKIDLPWHVVTKTGDGGVSVDRFEGNSGHFEWRIKGMNDGAWLSFECADSPVEPYFEAFLRGLSILTGTRLKPICRSIYEGNQQTTRILNRLHERDAEKLLAPMRMQRDFAEDAHLFLARFLEASANTTEQRDAPCTLAHRYWHRILRARASDIENSSLVLSVAVEGLIMKTLGSKLEVDADFVKQANDAKPLVENAGLGPRALDCVLKRLDSAAKPRVQDALRHLASEGVINDEHLKAWEKLRHAGAHGSVLEDNDRALQKHLDRFHVCLDLYYRLVFLLIGYMGKHTDFQSRGWPTGHFRSSEEVTASEADGLVNSQ